MPKLSVTIIARDERHNLPRAIGSVVHVADEIVVTDTGSTDGTGDIARELGARVAHFDWVDDFSAAHNYCNSLATGQWIFMLDADEELLPESRDVLATCIEQDDVLAFSVLRQDLVDESRPDDYSQMWQVRLFRNIEELRFVGRFHHHFSPPLETIAARRKLELRQSDVRLRHYGYLAPLKHGKNERAERLLELELRERPEQFYYLVELGLTKLALGKSKGYEPLARAAQMVVEGHEQALAAPGPLSMLLEHVLAVENLPSDFPLSRDAASRVALERFSNAVPLLWHIAADYNAHGRFAKCAQLLERIIKLGESHDYDHQVSFNPAIMGDDARLNLAVCCVRLGQIGKAKRLFTSLLDSPSRRRQAAENLRALKNLRR